MKKTKFFIAITSMVMGSVIALLLCPVVFFYFPNPSKRFLYIKQYFTHHNIDVIFLGNSVVMNGIDAKYYSQLRNGKVAFNLSTPGQSFFESLFLIENTPKPHRLVLGCSPQTLVSEINNIPYSNINALRMYGYNLSSTAASIIEKCRGEKTIKSYELPFFQHNFYCRWVIFSGVNAFFRSLIRKDLQLQNAQRNMFYPRPYMKKISKSTLKKLQKKYHVTTKKFVVNTDRIQFLRSFSLYLKEKNIKFTLLILPEHPYIRENTPIEFYRDMQAFLDKAQEEWNITIYNFHNILDESMFIDHIHPSQQGAKKLTEALAEN